MARSDYDQIADEYYDAGHITSRNFDHTTIEALKTHPFQVPTDGLVLEVGAGRGRANEFLQVPLSRVIQLDSSEQMLHLPVREASLLTVSADACQIPLVSQQFTGVV